METMLMDVVNGVLNAMVTVASRGVEIAVPLAAAILLLLVGGFLAHWVRYVVGYVLTEIKLDHYCDKGGVNGLIQRLGVGRSPAKVIGFLSYWTVMTAFLLPAADVMGLGVVREFLGDVLAFFPRCVAAAVVMSSGLFLGHFFGGILRGGAVANGLEEADFLGWSAYWVMTVFSGLLALQRLGIDTSILMAHPYLAVAAACGGGLFLMFNHHKGLGISFKLNGKVPHMVKTKA